MDNLKEIVKIANEAVAGIEEPLRGKAFDKILDKLLYESKGSKARKKSKKSKTRTTKKKDNRKEDDLLKKVSSSLNRSQYPEIYKFTKILDRSLYLLKVLRKEQELDGLSAPQISYILTNIFRIKTSKEAVSMGLMEAKLLVDREQVSIQGGGRTFIYKLMKEGEDHLEKTIKDISNKK